MQPMQMGRSILTTTFLGCILSLKSINAAELFEDYWNQAIAAFKRGDWQMTCEFVEQMHRWYGEEEVWQKDQTRKTLLPLWSIAALNSGKIDRGTELGETYLAEFQNPRGIRALLQYLLARTYFQQGAYKGSEKHFINFTREHGKLPEKIIANFWLARIYEQTGKKDDKRKVLTKMQSTESGPKSLREWAILALLSESSTDLSKPEAVSTLLNFPTPRSPLLALKRISLLIQCASQTARNSQWKSTLRLLIQTQLDDRFYRDLKVDLNKLRKKLNSNSRNSIRSQLWLNAHQSLQEELRGLLNFATKNRESWRKTTIQLKLQAYYRLDFTRVSAILAEQLYHRELDSPSHRKLAAKIWLESAMAEKQWKRALDVSHHVAETLHDENFLADIRFTMARIAAAQKQYSKAIHILNELLNTYKDHSRKDLWKFHRGIWSFSLGQFSQAVHSLRPLHESKNNPYRFLAGFWLIRSQYKRDPEFPVMEHLDSLRAEKGIAPTLHDEICIFQARHLYQEGMVKDAIDFIESICLSNDSFLYLNDIYNIKGDVLLDSNRIQHSINAYEQVSRDAHRPFAYSIERRLTCFRQLNRPEPALNLVKRITSDSQYLLRNDTLVISFKDYVPWILRKIPEKSKSLQNLFKSIADTVAANPEYPYWMSWFEIPMNVTTQPDDYLVWLRQNTPDDVNSIRYYRWKLATAEFLRRQNRKHQSESVAMSLLSQEKFQFSDPHVNFLLGRTAMAYDFPNPRHWFERALKTHHALPFIAQALLYCGDLDKEQGDWDSALNHYNRIIQKWSDSPTFYGALLASSEILVQYEQFNEAKSRLIRLVESRQSSTRQKASSYLQLGKIHARERNHKLACNCFLRVVELYPHHKSLAKAACFQAINLPVEAGEGSWKEALARKALEAKWRLNKNEQTQLEQISGNDTEPRS